MPNDISLRLLICSKLDPTKKKMMESLSLLVHWSASQVHRLICQPLLFFKFVPIKGAYTAEKDSRLNPKISVLSSKRPKEDS